MNILIDGRTWSRNAAGITTFLKCAIMEWSLQCGDNRFYVLLPKGLDSTIELPEQPKNVFLLDYSRFFPKRLPNIIILQLLVPYLCRKLHIDLYYSPLPHLPYCLPSHVRTLITVHDVVNIEMSHTMAWTNRLAVSFFFKSSVKKADFIWANSHYTRSKVEEYFPKRKSKKIFVGDAADRSLFYPKGLTTAQKGEIKQKFGISANRFLLFVGTLEPRKNLSFLLSIISDLYRKHGIQLVVVGGRGWKNSSIKTIVEASDFPQESTIFCGYISNEDLVNLYNTADCFVSAALMEGFGMPQLEALMCGCPVITADNTAMSEISKDKDGAMLVPGYDPAVWKEAILKMLDQKPLVNPSQLSEYDWKLIISQLTQFLANTQDS